MTTALSEIIVLAKTYQDQYNLEAASPLDLQDKNRK